MMPDFSKVVRLGLSLAVAAAASQPLPEKLIEEGHWKQARAIEEPWIRERPNDPRANFLLSQIRNAFHDRRSPWVWLRVPSDLTVLLRNTIVNWRKFWV
jgi:hypothetical protein